MKFRRILCVALVIASLTFVGCNGRDIVAPTTTAPSTTVNNPNKTTTLDNNVTHQNTTTRPTKVTTTIGDIELPTINDTSEVTVEKMSFSGAPVVVGDDRNSIRITNLGLLNGNASNPAFLLVTNIGEDDIYSATIKASVNGKEISFNISYLPKGGSVWAENADGYKYSSADDFVVNETAIIVSSSAAGVAIDRSYDGILKIYAGEKDGGKGLFVENVSGKKIKKLVVKYRPIASGAGLFAAPYQVLINDFESNAKFFKANSYLHDVYVADVQITY